MHQVRTNFLGKTVVTVSTVARTASCSHGWLRSVVEATFAIIIMASFILIVCMSVSNKPFPSPDTDHKCELVGCRVICEDLNFENGSKSMTNVLELAEIACDRVFLTLKRPMFINSSIPPYWLSTIRPNVMELAIFGGNLQHVSSQAFMTQFGGNIEYLILENVTISKLEPETFVGLSSINYLYIKSTKIKTIKNKALYAIDDTLQILTITDSGKWNPKFITGSSNLNKLVTVDFSSNHFSNIIGRESFLQLKSCQVLYLNSCGITSIGLGAFDDMPTIRKIYLNNNHLKQLPPGLFDKITTLPANPKPRVNLQSNPWFCDCSETELRRLTSQGMLLLDATCQNPENLRGSYLSQFENVCRTNESEISKTFREENNEKIYMSGSCSSKNDSEDIVWNFPIESLRCSNKILNYYASSQQTSALTFASKTTENTQMQAIIKPSFALKYDKYSMVEITSQELTGYGLIWYQSKCPREVYCVKKLPNFLRIYNLEKHSKYVFCPLQLSSGETERCILYSLDLKTSRFSSFKIVFSISIGVSCLIFGALLVYGLIRKYPTLLKGNDRILFVKHKSVDALILPPKVPFRTDDFDVALWQNRQGNRIFVIDEKQKGAIENTFVRTKSIKSDKSTAPTYVSALEPTDDQLAEWRLKHHFDNISIATSSVSLDVSTYSCSSDNKSLYCSFSDGWNQHV